MRQTALSRHLATPKAKLMARVGEDFPLECPGCGGDIRLRGNVRQEPAHLEPEVRKRKNARMASPARRAVSRPVCADEPNPALSVDRKLLGTSTIGPHPARPSPRRAAIQPLQRRQPDVGVRLQPHIGGRPHQLHGRLPALEQLCHRHRRPRASPCGMATGIRERPNLGPRVTC